MFKRYLHAGLCLVGMALLILGTYSSASAHAKPVSSVPAMNSTVRTAPSDVVVHFGESLDMSGSNLVVTGPDGATVSQGAATQLASDIKALSVALQSNLGDGTYTVQWTSKSADDGDAANGSFTFTVAATAAAAPVQQLPSTGVFDAHGMMAWLSLVGLAVLLTGVFLRQQSGVRSLVSVPADDAQR